MNDIDRQRSRFRPVRTDEQREKDTRLRELLEDAEWGDISARLTATAHRLMRKRCPLADAENVAQAAICQVLDPDYKDWDPEKNTLFKHLESVAIGIIHNQYVNAGERMRKKAIDIAANPVASEAIAVDDEVASRETAARVFTALRKHFANKRLETSVVELFSRGVELPREQVEELGLPYMQVYGARSRVVEQAQRILAELEKNHVNE